MGLDPEGGSGLWTDVASGMSQGLLCWVSSVVSEPFQPRHGSPVLGSLIASLSTDVFTQGIQCLGVLFRSASYLSCHPLVAVVPKQESCVWTLPAFAAGRLGPSACNQISLMPAAGFRASGRDVVG